MLNSKVALTRLSVVAIVVVIVVACIGAYYYYVTSTPASTKQELVIGVVESLSGSLADTGKKEAVGYRAWVKVINDEGGIYIAEYGRKLPLRLIMYDDKSDAATAASLAEKLITVDKADAIFCLGLTPPIAAIAPITEKYNKIFVCLSGTESLFQKGYRYVFSVNPPARDQARGIIEFFSTLEPLPSKLAFISLDSYYTLELTGSMLSEAGKKGGFLVVLNEKYPPGTSDFTPLLIRAMDSNPDALIMNVYAADGIALVRQMKQLNFRPKLVWIVSIWDSTTFVDLLGEDAEYLIGEHWWHKDWSDELVPGKSKFLPVVEAARADYIIDQHPFTAIMRCEVWRMAVEKAGSLDSEKVRTALLSLNVSTIGGPFRIYSSEFLMNTWWPGTVGAIVGQIQNGQIEIVWPSKLKTSEIRYPAPPW